ncbi:hypothetical protein [Mucilaginibacter jinjuensis]|uniref:Uncharacterized protein n=1 Tax=Mucilaginibacter jinjuensis TaxID=1176721 RepID=A0ABY7TAV7_9SPHI|nr:hypothetical protein [Mucilaginibacter jinjuensis]WCT13369.1 hypothetical protein PQO05_05405 [Mucilaginibacter jinjuensis]
MNQFKTELQYKARLFRFFNDPKHDLLDKKYAAFLELHDIEAVSDLYEIVESAPNDALCGRLIWTTEWDLSIELKTDILNVYSNHFVEQMLFSANTALRIVH